LILKIRYRPQSADAQMDHNSSSGSDMTTSSNDAEGVWSADIDQAFHEALRVFFGYTKISLKMILFRSILHAGKIGFILLYLALVL
jgi:hypothetical protein